jgi:uncharacterized protein (TIGR02001 family)
MMRKLVLSVVAASALAVPAYAADVMVPKAAPMVAPAPATPVFDIAFGGVVMSDYNFRGISQSDLGPSAGAYFEPQINTAIGTFYVGVGGLSIDWRSAYGFSDPNAEIDIYGGWRNSFGAFSVDIGALYYYYPGELFNVDSSFWEVYGKFAYAFTEDFTVGANVFYSPDVLNYSQFAFNAFREMSGVYASGTVKWVLPWKQADFGAFISGELGHWWLDNVRSANTLLFVDPSYTYWNAGIGLTYKAITLDLRYHGTDMNRTQCGNFLLAAANNPATKWCEDTFIVAIKFDTTVNALK